MSPRTHARTSACGSSLSFSLYGQCLGDCSCSLSLPFMLPFFSSPLHNSFALLFLLVSSRADGGEAHNEGDDDCVCLLRALLDLFPPSLFFSVSLPTSCQCSCQPFFHVFVCLSLCSVSVIVGASLFFFCVRSFSPSALVTLRFPSPSLADRGGVTTDRRIYIHIHTHI